MKTSATFLLLVAYSSLSSVWAGCCSSADCGSGQSCIGGSNCDGTCGTISTSGGCFTQDSTLEVLGRSEPTLMKDLHVGDRVRTASGAFEPIYAFGHLDADTKTEYLEIATTNNANDEGSNKLRVTKDHLIQLGNTNQFVPASHLQVGDALGNDQSIDKIRKVTDTGLYAPMTPSGTLVVDSVPTSCYISMQAGLPENLELPGGSTLLISHHTFLHLLASPLRVLCLDISPHLCTNEFAIDGDKTSGGYGYAWFTKFGFHIVDTLEQPPSSMLTTPLIGAYLFLLIPLCWTLESLRMSPTVAILALTALYQWRRYRGQAATKAV